MSDADMPPSRIETVTTAVRSGPPLADARAARALLSQCGHAITVCRGSEFRLVSERGELPLEAGAASLDADTRVVLSPGCLDTDGIVLAIAPAEGTARWVSVT